MTVHDSTDSRRASVVHLLDDVLVGALVPVDQVHLVGHHHQLVDAEQRRDAGVAAGLLAQAARRVHDHEGQVGGRGAGRHVAPCTARGRGSRR